MAARRRPGLSLLDGWVGSFYGAALCLPTRGLGPVDHRAHWSSAARHGSTCLDGVVLRSARLLFGTLIIS